MSEQPKSKRFADKYPNMSSIWIEKDLLPILDSMKLYDRQPRQEQMRFLVILGKRHKAELHDIMIEEMQERKEKV